MVTINNTRSKGGIGILGLAVILMIVGFALEATGASVVAGALIFTIGFWLFFIPLILIGVILGIIGLIIGAHLVVNAAILTANELGISELVIGVTAVAVGTSLPELSTSIVAAIRKEPDILVGNIIGSNIFNIGILGLVAIIHPVNVDPNLLRFELPVMLFFTLAALPIMKTESLISRVEGIFLLAFYLLFIVLLFYL